MKKENIKTKLEVFVCTHHRDDRESCAGSGSEELFKNLKYWSKEEHKGVIKVTKSGCIGKCKEGIAIACYPERNLLLEVTTNDEEELKRLFASKV